MICTLLLLFHDDDDFSIMNAAEVFRAARMTEETTSSFVELLDRDIAFECVTQELLM